MFPEGHEYVQAEKDGFRGFVVEFNNIISDVVVQDGYQSVLNLRTTLNLISKRHSRIKRCSRETDGAGSYNSVFVALMTLQLGTGNQLRTNHTPSQSVHPPSLSSHPCEKGFPNAPNPTPIPSTTHIHAHNLTPAL